MATFLNPTWKMSSTMEEFRFLHACHIFSDSSLSAKLSPSDNGDGDAAPSQSSFVGGGCRGLAAAAGGARLVPNGGSGVCGLLLPDVRGGARFKSSERPSSRKRINSFWGPHTNSQELRDDAGE